MPGRVENDVIETEPLFVRERRPAGAHAGACRRGPSASSAPASTSARCCGRRPEVGPVIGLGVGVGLLLVWLA